MRTGKDRVLVEELAGADDSGGARVAPGDIVRGDPDGVVVIPAAHEEEVLAAAEEIHAAEEAIRATARTGVRLDEARRRYNYHNLQTRRVE
jgi:regulator of RNase E activity RraA